MSLTYEAGTYQAEISDIGMDFDSEGKQPVIKVRARILHRILEDGAAEPCAQQYERTVWLNCSPKAKKYVLLKLRHAGWSGSDFNGLREALLAQNCRFVNRPETALSGKYEGQLVEKWDMELPPKPQSEAFEAKPAAVEKLNQIFAEALAEPVPQPEPVPAGGPPPDDEIPF